MDPTMISAIGGLMGGLMGGGEPQMTPQADEAYRWLRSMAKWFNQYAKGIPGSDPQEGAALAQANALLGNMFQGQRDQVMAAGGNPWGANGVNATDLMENLQSSLMANKAAMTSQHMLDSLGRRQQARGTAADIMGRAAGVAQGGTYTPQGSNLASLMGNLAQSMAYTQALNRNRPMTPAPGGGGGAYTPVGGDTPTHGYYGQP